MLKKPRSLVESCCPYENMVPRFTVKVEGVHFVETAVIFCRMHCVTLLRSSRWPRCPSESPPG